MAKLSGVKTLDMVNGEITKVEYNGAVYEKVDGKAKAGDIGLRINNEASWANIGSFYPVVRDGVYSDNGDSEPYIEMSQWHFFRKASADQSPTPSTDALTDRVSTLEQRVDALEGKTAYGFKLVTDCEPKAGDFVKFTDDDELPSYLTVGKYYEITEIDGWGDPQILDDDGDDHDTCGYTYEVYEKVGAEAPKEVELKVGDYVKVISEGQYGGVDVGEYGIVVKGHGEPDEYRVDKLDASDHDYFYAHNLVKVTEEDVVEAKAEQAFAKFFEGDKVRLLSGGEEFPLYGFHDGKIYTVKKPKTYHSSKRGNMVCIVNESGRPGYAKPHQLEKVTAEQAEKIRAEQAEQARWAKIGRKPNEFKKGDIAKVVDSPSASPDGTFVEVTDSGLNVVHAKGWSQFLKEITSYMYGVEDIELVIPAEQRFDFAEVSA